MSCFRTRVALLALTLVASLALVGCSGFRPVYADPQDAVQRVELAYSQPSSRLEQIVIDALKLRFSPTARPGAPILRISASASARDLTSTRLAKPFTQREITVSVRYVLTAGGHELASGTRSGTAGYGASGQVMADEAARKDATDRAGLAAAESVRLALLAVFANPTRLAVTGE